MLLKEFYDCLYSFILFYVGFIVACIQIFFFIGNKCAGFMNYLPRTENTEKFRPLVCQYKHYYEGCNSGEECLHLAFSFSLFFSFLYFFLSTRSISMLFSFPYPILIITLIIFIINHIVKVKMRKAMSL